MGTETEQDINNNEKNYTQILHCSNTTKRLIMENCVQSYLHHHRELRGTTIKQGHILRQIAEFYLKS